MGNDYFVSSSTVVPVTPDVAFQGLLDAPLERLFPHRSGPLPSIARCEGQVGAWSEVGQTRNVVLSDGTGNLETLVGLSRPSDYRYRITGIEGPFKLLVSSIDGRFTFEPEGDGTRATWSWTLHGRNVGARLAYPALGFFWRRWAARMWPNFAGLVTT
ncbi:SRPBCC family protein [Nocardioides marmorisolisilvae]|uniref:SRPBCC family protein n=1 Tax=Nocardioides marmorisolisilvae TaxID=1542737 RepID=A0A3N0DQP2_9ACTN|nr:SRPBCC family protein [Nocardioides marmorisolisilvae]RNL77663.1 SRPBCC family protein [Nocardioides marmorisolisilvae]